VIIIYKLRQIVTNKRKISKFSFAMSQRNFNSTQENYDTSPRKILLLK